MNAVMPIKVILRDRLARLGLSRRIKEGLVLVRWAEVVGPDIARVTAPLWVRDRVLWVAVESAPWANELSLMAPSIIKKLNASTGRGTIREIKFRISHDNAGREAKPLCPSRPGTSTAIVQTRLTGPQQAEAAPQDRDYVLRLCSGIRDEDLRNAFRKAVIASLTLQRKRPNLPS